MCWYLAVCLTSNQQVDPVVRALEDVCKRCLHIKNYCVVARQHFCRATIKRNRTTIMLTYIQRKCCRTTKMLSHNENVVVRPKCCRTMYNKILFCVSKALAFYPPTHLRVKMISQNKREPYVCVYVCAVCTFRRKCKKGRKLFLVYVPCILV
jgi:hypothetical protein